MKSLLLLVLLLACTARAQNFPSGQYRGEAELGPVLLDGRYPLTLDDPSAAIAGSVGQAGMAELVTSPTGALSGSIVLLGRAEAVVGQITSRARRIKLALRGKVGEGSFSMRATLKGNVFIGVATIRGKRTVARLDITGIGPIRASYDVMLTAAANGVITGTGTATVARTGVPLVATGRVAKGKITLTLKGGKTSFFGFSRGFFH